MSKYIRPIPANAKWRVTSDYADHANRRPPSSEPGTDYGVDRGTPVVAIAAGKVVGVKITPSGAMGRYVMIDHGGGHYSRVLHLSQTRVYEGQLVNQGDTIGLSGGSAWGSETGVGAHVHLSFWHGFKTRAPIPGSDRPSPYENFLGTPTPGGVVQRRAVAFVNRRAGASTRHAILPRGLEAGDIGNFNGFVRGQMVEGNNIWFRGISGNYFWSGGFAGGADTSGMIEVK